MLHLHRRRPRRKHRAHTRFGLCCPYRDRIEPVNVNLIAYNWNQPDHWSQIIPPWSENIMILAMVTLHIRGFRWIMNRFPGNPELPEYRGLH
jgi:hypothetical protein